MCQKQMTLKKYLRVFPISLKLTNQYQQKHPILMDKYKRGKYKTGSFCGGSYIYLNPMTCEDKIIILLIMKSYVLHWFHRYLLHPRMDKTEAMNFQHLYWPDNKRAIRMEVKKYDTCQLTKRPNKNMLNYQLRNPRKYHGTNSV